MLAQSIATVDAFRDANPTQRIVDVHYAELVRDPMGTMRRVYAAFGDELDGQARRAMADHIQSHPKGRFGRHAYDLSEFGLDAAAIAEKFRPYVERYDIAVEPFANA
jgi:hypothetical protein